YGCPHCSTPCDMDSHSDRTACRGWRFCQNGCPYHKVYYNWNTHKAEKCNFCYPRTEAGLPTICSETCVGRIRYIGVV
ncbi:4Fe-4S dicluster domain-containing protein, partial [Alkalihalophilus lindianensis]